MCDSGAEVNLIKLSALKNCIVPIPIKIVIAGMCGGRSSTVGVIKAIIGDRHAIFHVMEDGAATFRCDGILGSEFFWEPGVDLLYSENILKVGKFRFPLQPRDKCKKVREHWETQIANKAPSRNPWEGAHMEADLTPRIGGVRTMKIGSNDNSDAQAIGSIENKPAYECFRISSLDDDRVSPVLLPNLDDEPDYEVSYCDFRMAAYEAELSVMEHRSEQGIETIFQPCNLSYYEDFNSEQKFHGRMFHETSHTISRLDKILSLAKLDNLSDKEYNSLVDILDKYIDVPYLKGDKWKGTELLKHRIHMSSDNPVNVRKHKIPYKLIDVVNDQIAEWLRLGIVRPSKSPYNSPIWVVPKKADSLGNARWRVVTDFRKLNDFTEDDSYPLPIMTNIFDKIGKAKYYTKLDLSSGFLQIPVDERDIPKTAFSTDFGHYEFVRMPFGLKTAPKTFQRAMDIALQGLIGRGIFCYMDDILIYAKSLEEHNRILDDVMQRLKKYNFKIEIDKCEFLRREVSYLGHVLGPDGVKPCEKKIEAVKHFPIPKNQKNVRQFLGLSGFYRRFIKDYAKIGRPLFDLLKKDIKFHWTTDCQKAFDFLKNELCKAPILVFPDLTKEFLLFTDASGFAIGALLAQGSVKKNNPIAYFSRALRGAELNYSTYEKEALAIHDSIKHFRQYLYGSKFTVVTDHKPLLTMLEAENNGRVQRMRLKLQGYDMKIVHTPGKENLSADALSRNIPVLPQTLVVTRGMQRNLERPIKPPKEQRVEPELEPGIPPRRGRGRPRKNPPNPVKPQGYPVGIKLRPKLKKGRPIKGKIDIEEEEIDAHDPYSSDEESDLDMEETDSKNVVVLKDLFEFRKDHLLYFVDLDGNPLDDGADRLTNIQRRPIRVSYSEGIYVLKRNKKYLFEVVMDINKGSELLRKEMRKMIQDVMVIIREKKLKSISISKGKYIGILQWSNVLEILIAEKVENTTILICENKLSYVKVEERDRIFEELHCSPQGGHRGVLKTYKRIRNNYYWENMRKDINDRIKRCVKCNVNKVRRRIKNPMLITDTPYRSFDKIAMDIVGPYPKTERGNEYVLTIQDLLTKYVTLIPLPNQTAETVTDAFVKRFVSYFACPRILLTDLGTNFKSNLFRQLAKKFRIKKVFTTPARPQSNSSLEKSHGSLHDFLRHYIDDKHEWDDFIEFAQLCYNTSVHESTNFTPYELLFGFEAREPSVEPTAKDDTYGEYYKSLIKKLKNIQSRAHQNLLATKHKTKLYYDRKINPNELKIGDKVYKLIFAARKKLHPYEEGPFEVLDVDVAHKNAIIKYKKNKPKKVHLDYLRLAIN